MKLLVVAPYPPCEDTNGLRARAWTETLLRERPELEVLIVASERCTSHGPNLADRPDPAGSPKVVRAWRRGTPARRLVRTVLAAAEEFRPDVAHLHFNYLTYGNPIKSFLVLDGVLRGLEAQGIPTLVTLHSVVASPSQYLAARLGLEARTPSPISAVDTRLSGFVLGRALRRASEVVAVSPEAADWLGRRTRLDPRRIRCIPLGAGPEVPADSPEPPCRTGATPTVTSVGRLVPYKGLEDLIRAVALLDRQGRAVRLTIMGDVPSSHLGHRWYIQRLRRLVRREEQGSVRLEARYVQDPEYVSLRERSDVVALPFRDDGVLGTSGTVLDLGAACSARIVLTDVPRLRGYRGVQGVTYCRAGDVVGLAEAIWSAARAPPVPPDQRRWELASLSARAVTARYLEAYLDLVRSGSAGPSAVGPELPGPALPTPGLPVPPAGLLGTGARESRDLATPVPSASLLPVGGLGRHSR